MEVRQLEKYVFNNNVKNNQAKDILAHQPAKGLSLLVTACDRPAAVALCAAGRGGAAPGERQQEGLGGRERGRRRHDGGTAREDRPAPQQYRRERGGDRREHIDVGRQQPREGDARRDASTLRMSPRRAATHARWRRGPAARASPPPSRRRPTSSSRTTPATAATTLMMGECARPGGAIDTRFQKSKSKNERMNFAT